MLTPLADRRAPLRRRPRCSRWPHSARHSEPRWVQRGVALIHRRAEPGRDLQVRRGDRPGHRDAKVTSESSRRSRGPGGRGNPAEARSAMDACSKQWKGELGKTYTVKADCTVGSSSRSTESRTSSTASGIARTSAPGGPAGRGPTGWSAATARAGSRPLAAVGGALSGPGECRRALQGAESLASHRRSESRPVTAASVCGGDPRAPR